MDGFKPAPELSGVTVRDVGEAQEAIFLGDIVVIDPDTRKPRRMRFSEAGERIGPGLFDYAFDKIKIEGIASSTCEPSSIVNVYSEED